MIIKRQKEYSKIDKEYNEILQKVVDTKRGYKLPTGTNVFANLKNAKEKVAVHDKLILGRMEGKSPRALMERINQKTLGREWIHRLSKKMSPKEIMKFRLR